MVVIEFFVVCQSNIACHMWIGNLHLVTRRTILACEKLCCLWISYQHLSNLDSGNHEELADLKRNWKLEAKDVLPNVNRTQAAERAKKCRFLSLVTLTFDLDPQSRLSEGPNMFSVWIWCRSVQHFRRYFIHKQKSTDWRCQKQNLPQFAACNNNTKHNFQTVYNYCIQIKFIFSSLMWVSESQQ